MNDPRPPFAASKPPSTEPPARRRRRAGSAAGGALRGPHGLFAPTEGDPRSLFGEMLDWVLAPLLFLWPMSLALTWIVAQNIAHQPYDAELSRLVQALAAEVSAGREPLIRRNGGAEVAQRIERAAHTLVQGDDEVQRWFQVLGRRGELLAGDAALAVPPDGPTSSGEVHFRDDTLHDTPVRVAYLWLATRDEEHDNDALVQMAETPQRRERLAIDIIKGVLLPQFLILPLAVVLVWLALSRGFRPLEELQQLIRRRTGADLSPIPERGVPEEVAPLVRAVNDLLQRQDRSLANQRQFLADAAHQLKTPLAGLRTQAELAQREIDGGRGDAKVMKHSLRQIAVSSQRAAHMVNQLLAMARAEADSTTLRPQWVDLGAITRSVVRDFVPRALERRIDLGYEGPEDETGATLPARLMAEPVLLGELVRNLVDNALQYTPAGGTVTARVMADAAGGALVLEVEDTGPGIAPGERELVFQPFYRALGTQVDGSGLGLAIVREVALRHGASVTIEDARPRHEAKGGTGGMGGTGEMGGMGGMGETGETGETPGARFTVRLSRGEPPPAA